MITLKIGDEVYVKGDDPNCLRYRISSITIKNNNLYGLYRVHAANPEPTFLGNYEIVIDGKTMWRLYNPESKGHPLTKIFK